MGGIVALNDAEHSAGHQQLRGWVVEQLRAAILQGELAPGAWLRQERLAQQLNVSQMPVREALKQLTAEGLVEHIPYRGVRVVSFSPEDVEDLYAHRGFLEGRVSRIAAGCIAEAALDRLRETLDAMCEHMGQEALPTYRALNRQFHQTIAEACGREYLERELKQLWDTFPNMLWNTFATTSAQSLPERDANDLEQHEAILAALRAHDPAAAERAMVAHINSAGQDLIAALQKTQGATAGHSPMNEKRS